MELSPVEQKFVLHMGEMGNRWGVNRTIGQIHALLFISPRPLDAEEIATTLSVARSNVSTSIKELIGWGIVRPVHVLGDRREHYETMSNVWEMFRVVAEERRRREIDPTVNVLRECVAELEDKGSDSEKYTRERLSQLLEFMEAITEAFAQMRSVPTDKLRQIFLMEQRLEKLLSLLPGGKKK